MTMYSQDFPIRIRRQRAFISVARNEGYCWGQVTFPCFSGRDQQFSVYTKSMDLYDRGDEEAAETLTRIARRDPDIREWIRKVLKTGVLK